MGIGPFPPSPGFPRRPGFLRTMVSEVQRELEAGYYARRRSEEGLVDHLERPSLVSAIRSAPLSPALLVELKHASPGYTQAPLDELSPELFVKLAQEGGADALSVIPQPFRFGGTLEEFGRVARRTTLPVLFKDFVLSPLQIEAARHWGASAVLLLARLEREGGLELPIAGLVAVAHEVGLETVVEVHEPDDIPLAIHSRTDIVGVNARDLESLELNPPLAHQVLGFLKGIRPPLIGMSGVEGPVGVRRFREAGADAVLVGTGFVAAENRLGFLTSLRDRPAGGDLP